MNILTEIPMQEPGAEKPSTRPMEVLSIVLLVAVNAVMGVVAAVIGLDISGDAISVVGFIIAVIALWVAKGLWDMNAQAWTWALILSIIGIPLYAFSVIPFEGIFLCVITLVYLNTPLIKKYYQ